MTAFKKQYKDIYNQYNKKLLADHKANFSAFNNNLDYFVTYLKFLRDYHLLTDDNTTSEEDVKMSTATLVAACSEYEKYENCIMKYYRLNGNVIERISDESEEEVAKKYNLEKKFHWTNFWQLVMTNIEGWSVNG